MMRKAETLLGVSAAVLGVAVVTFTLTHRTEECYWAWHYYPSGGRVRVPVTGFVPPSSNAPALLLGSGALLVLLGAVIDARVQAADDRILLLAMVLTGAIFSVFADIVVGAAGMWVAVWRSSSDAAQCPQLTPQAGPVELGLLYTPVTVVCILCALVALARHESRRTKVA